MSTEKQKLGKWGEEEIDEARSKHDNKSVDFLLDNFLNSESPNDRAVILDKLELLAPEMSRSDLALCSAVLEKAREKEGSNELKTAIDKLLSLFLINKKVLEFDKLEKPIYRDQNGKIKENESKLIVIGFALGVLGLIMGLLGVMYSDIVVDYEFGCTDSEFIEDKYGQVDEETLKQCLDEYEDVTHSATFFTLISPVLILFGILSVVYGYTRNK